MAQLVGALFCALKGCWFDSESGHIPGLWVASLVRVCTGGNKLMFLSHIIVSLSLSLSLSPPLPLKSKETCPWVSIKKTMMHHCEYILVLARLKMGTREKPGFPTSLTCLLSAISMVSSGGCVSSSSLIPTRQTHYVSNFYRVT